MEAILQFLSRSQEFADIRIRKGERQALNDVNKAARFRQTGKVQTTPVSAQ
jgi:hypothetical protein